MQVGIPKVEFDTIRNIAAWCITSNVNTRDRFLRGENYAYVFVWNELYILPYKGFLIKFLQRLGIKEKGFTIRHFELEPKLHLNRTPVVRPDVLIETDKNVIVFEFKNFYKGGEFQEEQIPREYFAGLKLARGNPAYLVLVTNEEGPYAKIASRGEKLPYEEIKSHSRRFLNREGSWLRRSYGKHFDRNKVILLSWRAFLRGMYKQLGSSKKQAGKKDLEEIYGRVMRRIQAFVQMRKHLHKQSASKNKEVRVDGNS